MFYKDNIFFMDILKYYIFFGNWLNYFFGYKIIRLFVYISYFNG